MLATVGESGSCVKLMIFTLYLRDYRRRGVRSNASKERVNSHGTRKH